jgi:hypothetical protein
MKRGTPEHPKTLDLSEAIELHLQEHGLSIPSDACHTIACGLVEKLFHYTARYASQGDVGKHSDTRIARALGWCWDGEWLIQALVTTKWLDRDISDICRLYVHDWHIHSDDTCDRYLADNGLQYATGDAPRNKPRKNSRNARGTHAERGTNTAERGLTETETETETETDKDAANDARVPPAVGGTKRAKFRVPTVEEVRAYCLERGNSVEPQLFVDSYTAKGWKVGKTPMSDWKAAVRTWEQNGNQFGRTTPPATAPPVVIARPVPSRIPQADFTR